jgi:hypothetical protein
MNIEDLTLKQIKEYCKNYCGTKICNEQCVFYEKDVRDPGTTFICRASVYADNDVVLPAREEWMKLNELKNVKVIGKEPIDQSDCIMNSTEKWNKKVEDIKPEVKQSDNITITIPSNKEITIKVEQGHNQIIINN